MTYPDCTAPASCAASDPARTITNTYANGFLTAVPGYATSISYHRNGLVNTIAHANGLSTVQAIAANNMARPSSFTVQDSVSGYPLWTTSTYQYDGAGNVKNMGWNYSVYDRLGRVVEGSAEYVSPTNGKIQRYTYDPYGNMLSMTTLVNGATTTTRTMGAVASTNRLCSGSPCSSGNLGLVDYDDAGNLKSIGGKTYAFDSQNMMATQSDGPFVNYVYTADDERIWAYTSSPSTSSRWTLRGIDGKVLREYTTTGTAGAQSWTFSKDYVHRGSSVLAAVANGGAVTHLHQDHLGSTRLVTNASKAVLERIEYFPFGEESAPSGAETKKFTGHERDYNASSGWTLDYMHARYYSPYLGRFLSVDPAMNVKRAIREPQAWNRYSYVVNNPINRIDPDGRVDQNWDGGAAQQLFPDDHAAQIEFNEGVARKTAIGAAVTLGAVFGGPPAWKAAGAFAFRHFTAARIAMAMGLGMTGAPTAQQLQRLTQAGGPTVQLTTNLTQAPQAGRALSAAAGEGAQALADAARSGGGARTFVANIPQALLKGLEQAQLVEQRTTMINGVKAVEYRFAPGAAEYITQFFKEVTR